MNVPGGDWSSLGIITAIIMIGMMATDTYIVLAVSLALF